MRIILCKVIMSPYGWNSTRADVYQVRGSTYSGHLAGAGVQDVSGVARQKFLFDSVFS